MKKMLKLLIFLFLMYTIFQVIFNIFSNGHQITYYIKGDKEFEIKEKRVNRTKGEIDNYYFEISFDDKTYSIQTYDKLNNATRVIKDIKYYKDDEYECILPLSDNDKVFSDVICKRNDLFYLYNNIKYTDQGLDEFVSSIQAYNMNNYIDSDEVIKNNGNILIYKNLDENTIIGLEYYKGIYLFKNKIGFKEKGLFNKDTYQKYISGYIGKYYVVADYNQEYEFHDFKLIDMETYQVSTITSNAAISMYSYVQGIVDNSMYIFDPNNKKQYELNVKKKDIYEIGNEKKGIKKYEDKKFVDANIYDAINNKMIFNIYEVNNVINNKTYDKVDLVGNNLSGYYYMFEKVGGEYNVYRANVQNVNNITYLFKTTDINNIVYLRDHIYFKDGSYIKFYSDMTGLKKLIKYNEVTFNLSLKFGVYEK